MAYIFHVCIQLYQEHDNKLQIVCFVCMNYPFIIKKLIVCLAYAQHTNSICSEPGSNSQLYPVFFFFFFNIKKRLKCLSCNGFKPNVIIEV